MSCLSGFRITQLLEFNKKHNCEPRSIEGTWELKKYHMRTSVNTQGFISLRKHHIVCLLISNETVFVCMDY